MTFFAAGMPALKPSELLAGPAAASEPIQVYTGPTRTGAALIAAVASDTEKQTAKPRGKRAHVASKKSGADSKDTKPAATHVGAKPDAAPKSADASAAKPAKRKTAAKPSGKPAPKNTSG
jgi:D-alanyl-D-alanine carboxypeptidase